MGSFDYLYEGFINEVKGCLDADSGVSDYVELDNKPQINGVELLGNKTASDLGIGEPTNEQVSDAVNNWLDAHPEATTTVEDGSITPEKLSSDFELGMEKIPLLPEIIDNLVIVETSGTEIEVLTEIEKPAIVKGALQNKVLVQNHANFTVLNNYITPAPLYYEKVKIVLREHVLLKLAYFDADGNYLHDTGWQSINNTQWTTGGVNEFVVEDSYVALCFASDEYNETGEYVVTAEEMLSRITMYEIGTKKGSGVLKSCTVNTDAIPEKSIKMAHLADEVTKNIAQFDNDLSGARWLFIGDSITEHNSRATKNYDEYLSEWLGCTSVNVAKSGTGVTYAFQGNPGWLDALPNYPNDVDVISIMGALNDRNTTLGAWGDRGTDTVYGAVWNFFNNLIAKYPNKPIIYITSTPRDYSYGVDGEYTAWVDAFIETAHNFSIPVLDLYRESGLRPWNATNNATYFSCDSSPNGDGTHPNEKGQLLIAKKIYNFAKQYL